MKNLTIFIILLLSSYCFSQTTDLAVSVEAQNLSGTDVSQVHIYEEFQYLITISNSGAAVNDVTFSQIINTGATVMSFVSQNPVGGASNASNLLLSGTNELTGSVASMPSASSVEVKVILRAPLFVGGIATNVIVSPPDGTTDTNTSNNQSIISIEVTDVDIDFTVTMQQISPDISAWGDNVTYQFTIANNSIIDYPLDEFMLKASLTTPFQNGSPNVQIQSLNCISTTGGAACPTTINISNAIIAIGGSSTLYLFTEDQLYPSNSSVSYEVVYKYLDPECVLIPGPIEAENFVELTLNHDNVSSNESNRVNSIFLEAEECLLTDVAIETTIISPIPNSISTWNDDVILETEVTNFGPLAVPIRFFLQNLTANISSWNIISVTCLEATGGVTCNNISYTIGNTFWNSNNFIIPVGAVIRTETVLRYIEPVCTPETQTYTAQIRSAINLLSEDILDSDYSNNLDDDFMVLLPTLACPTADLEVTKTQIFPVLPIGGSDQTPMDWQDITYEVTVSNIGLEDTFMTLQDNWGAVTDTNSIGTLLSVTCVSATGGASCETITTENIGIPIDENSTELLFWGITLADAWEMPAGASVTFEVTINWQPDCNNVPIEVINGVGVAAVIGANDGNPSNNNTQVVSYFTPCVDLVVQTFPSSTTVSINSPFNWIVDITNSGTSSNAIDVAFEDIVSNEFTITSAPTCQVTNGNASCISSFNVTGNTITGLIPNMEAGSTIRITIPVMAPNFGGAFNNIAEATPSPLNNEEVTPETNISISSVQVIAPTLSKAFNPNLIFVQEISTLTFTITNINTNPNQSNIGFIDNLPNGLVLAGTPEWVESNGCTATFLGNANDIFVGVSGLTFPSGIETCSFSVPLTSSIAGIYVNEHGNFINQSNIDTSQVSATLEVLADNSNVDIEILKEVTPQEVSIGDEVVFTITATNLGTTLAHNIEVLDVLPTGYLLVSNNVSNGTFLNNVWSIATLDANQSEELTIVAQVLPAGIYLNVALLQDVDEIDRDDTNNEDSAEITIDNCLQIPEGFSPNNDSVNDFFVIPCIDDYPDNNIKIYNRYGVLIYEKTNYKNDWNGRPNKGTPRNNNVPASTYFYVLTLDNGMRKSGWVYITK